MSAVIMLFDRRGVRANPDDSHAQVLAKVRQVAIGKGCNSAQKAIVVGAAELWLDQGIRHADVIERARAKAIQLVADMHRPDGPSAA